MRTSTGRPRPYLRLAAFHTQHILKDLGDTCVGTRPRARRPGHRFLSMEASVVVTLCVSHFSASAAGQEKGRPHSLAIMPERHHCVAFRS
jgi:hypothetical protein